MNIDPMMQVSLLLWVCAILVVIVILLFGAIANVQEEDKRRRLRHARWTRETGRVVPE